MDYKCDGCEQKLTFNEYYNHTENIKFSNRIYTLCKPCAKLVEDFIIAIKKG